MVSIGIRRRYALFSYGQAIFAEERLPSGVSVTICQMRDGHDESHQTI